MSKRKLDDQTLLGIVTYIENSQRALDKYAGFIKHSALEQGKLMEKVSYIVDTLVKDGEVPAQFADSVKQDLAMHPSKLADLFINKKIASAEFPKMGESSGQYNSSLSDPILDFCFS